MAIDLDSWLQDGCSGSGFHDVCRMSVSLVGDVELLVVILCR